MDGEKLKMKIEISLHNPDMSEMEIKKCITDAINTGLDINEISVLPYNLKATKRILKNSKICISTPIDFPLGVSDDESRIMQCQSAINNGAMKLDIVAPSSLIVNKKYDRIRQEVATIKALCEDNNIEFTYMLEYRLFTHSCLQRICKLLKTIGVRIIYPSSGYLLDNIIDNTIAAMYLSQKTGIKTIINGDLWNTKQAEKIIKQQPYGIRLKTLNGIRVFYDALQ